MMKLSAYWTRCTFVLAQKWFSMLPLEFQWNLSWITFSRPSNVIFAYRLEIALPCGEPVSVGNSSPLYMKPDFRNCFMILLSIGILDCNHS